MSQPSTEVLIVGAGPTGLMLACDLLRRDIPFRIIDRAEGPSTLSRAVNIQARTLEAFDDLGVLPLCYERGLFVQAVRTYRDGRLQARYELNTEPTDENPYPYLLVLEQQVTEQILAGYLNQHGVTVERGLELRRLVAEPDQVKCLLRGRDGDCHLRASYVVGCDGAHSAVRNLAGIKLDTVSSPVIYRLADVEIKWDIPHGEVVRFEQDVYEFFAIPLPGKLRYRLSLWESQPGSPTSESSDYGALEKSPAIDSMESLLTNIFPGSVKLLNSRPVLSYKAGVGMGATMLKGRVILAGDSAHQTPQCTSQGMNLGLQDAYNLGWKLALVIKEDAPAELLHSYNQERRNVAAEILETAQERPSALGRATHFASSEALDLWSQLHLNYRDSQLSLTPSASAIRAGDRMPDGQLATDGMVTQLYDVMDGLSHHLLAFSDREDPDLERLLNQVEELYAPMVVVHEIGLGPDACLDVNRSLHRAFGAHHGDLVLIRPDRFIGARGSIEAPAELLGHLASYLIPRVS